MGITQQLSGKRLKSLVAIVFNTVGFISSIITIAAVFTVSFLATIITWFTDQQRFLIPLGSFTGGIFVSLVVLGIFEFKYSRSLPVRWLLRGYRWVSAEYLYCIEDDTLQHHSQTITIVLRATRPGVNLFENKYSWTGQGEEKMPIVLSEGHELMGSITKQEFYYGHTRWKYYYIYLGHELTLGEEVTVVIRQDLYDQNGKFQPYLAKTITEPIKSLKLRVLVPENRSPKRAFNCELNHPEPNSQILHKEPSTCTIVRYNGKLYEEISYEVPKPRLGRRCEIRWEW